MGRDTAPAKILDSLQAGGMILAWKLAGRGCGPGCRGFKPHHPPQISIT